MKRTRLLPLVFLTLMLASSLDNADAQVGPGGVGSLTNTQLWLRSDSLIAIQPLNFVTTWYDLSGHARDFSAIVTGQSVPSWTLDVLNGYPVVTFSDQGGTGGDFLGYNASVGITGTDAATVVIVARNSTAADEANGGLYLGQRNVGGVNAVRSYGLEYADAVRFNGQDQVFNDGHTLNDWRIIVYSNVAGAAVSGYRGYLSGTPLTGSSSSSVVPSLVANLALLGATQMNGTFNSAGYFNGDMAEVALFSGSLNDAERVVVDNNLGAKYLIPISDDHYSYEITHSHDVSGLAAFNGTTFTNAWSAGMLSVTSPTSLTEGEYLFFGHDKADAESWVTNEVPAPGTWRLRREWRFDETGETGTVTINIPASSLPTLPPGYSLVGVLTDADGDFSSGAVMHRATLAAGIYSLTMDITDGDYMTIIAWRPEINYTIAAASGLESVTPVTVQVSLNYPLPSDVSFDFTIAGGTATNGTDYILTPATVTIPAGSVSGSFNITIINDALVEPDETIITGLANPSAGLFIGSNNSYQYTILNDDNVYVSLSAATASGAEGNSPAAVTTPTLVVSGGIITSPGSLLLVVTNGTAGSDDWSQTSALITIPAGDYTTPVSIPIPASALTILGDLVVEPDETINLGINTFTGVMAGAILSSVYTIINDDSATLSVTTSTPNITEGNPGVSGTGTFTFTLTSPLSTARTISYSVTGTATSGTDYTALAGSFIMPANTLTHTLNLSPVADIIIEGDETVIVTITGVSGTPAVTVDVTPATITIVDDDTPQILYSPSSVTMNEGGTSTIEVWLSGPPAGTVTLNLSTLVPGLLTLGTTTLTFNASNYSVHQVVTIQAAEDNIMGDRSDNVIISVNDALSDDVFDPLPDIIIPVTIINNDVAAIIATPTTVNVNENGTATFTVTLSAIPPAGNVVIDLVSNDLTVATIDLAQLTFTALNWNIPQTVTVTGVNNNTIPDATTTISLTVNNGLSDDEFDDLTATVTVNVINDDTPGFIVAPLTLTINEGGPAGQFTIVLTAQPQSDVVFDLINLSPVYVTTVGQVTFTPANWNIPVVVNVTAIEDALDADRTDIITVTVNQAGSDDTFDSLASQDVTVNIEDNDPPVITGCPSDINVPNDAGLCSAVVTWTEPVSTAPMVSDHNPGDNFPVGVTTVTYTSTDGDGMVSTCTFNVTVNDTEAPVISCINATIDLDAGGNATIVQADLLSAAPADNCSVPVVTLNRSSFTCSDLGAVTVTVTATDAAGNTASCDAVVTVADPFTASLNAGPDDMICVTDPSYSITGATSDNVTLMWTSSGDGTFSDPTIINPVYTRGSLDLTSVTLTLSGTKIDGCAVTLTDDMVLTFAGLPAADAGSDRQLCSGTPDVALTDASASNGSVSWTTSGDGTFSDPAATNPVYTFGVSDTGPVTLTMTVTSLLCGSVSDALTVTFTGAPVADAGGNTALCRTETGYQVTGASHSNGTVLWSSSGNGTFDDATSDNPYYSFGSFDYSLGTVTLTMTVTGTGPCGTDESDAVITIYPLPAIQVIQHDDISCTGQTDGEIHLGATTGMAPYSFSIDGSPFQPSGDFINLSAGDYYFEVMDDYGCVSDTTITIIEPLPFIVTLDSTHNVACFGGSSGAIYITADGGTEPYDINWTGPDGFTSGATDLTGVVAGDYSLSITDLNGCASFNFSATLTEPPQIEITSSTLSDHNGFGVSCSDNSDGTISVTASGGTAPLAFLWSGPAGFSSTLGDISGLSGGIYTLTITDAAGCELTADFELTMPEVIAMTAEVSDAACPDTPDGTIEITVTGGAGTVAFIWDDGTTTMNRTGMLPGDYTITATDENGCSVDLKVSVGMTGAECLTVYEIITPNGDGSNDTWKIRNAFLYPNAEVFVYSRWGRLVYHSRNLTDEWDGTYNGALLPNDSYHYVLHLNDGSEPRTGVITIISK